LSLLEKQELVKKVFDLLAEELILVLKENPDPDARDSREMLINPINPEELNRRLIERLRNGL